MTTDFRPLATPRRFRVTPLGDGCRLELAGADLGLLTRDAAESKAAKLNRQHGDGAFVVVELGRPESRIAVELDALAGHGTVEYAMTYPCRLVLAPLSLARPASQAVRT